MQITKTNCSACELKERCVWRNLATTPDIDVTPRIYHRSKAVYRAGEECEGLYVVRSGTIKTYWIGSDGTEQVLGFHGVGSLFGVESLGQGSHVNHADSLETSSVCVLPTEELTKACANSPTSVLALFRSMANFAKENERTQVWLGTHNAEQRLAAFLLETARSQATRGCATDDVQLPMPRRDIAKHLALAVETLSRLFAKLEASGTVRVDTNDRRRIHIDSLSGLSELASANAVH